MASGKVAPIRIGICGESIFEASIAVNNAAALNVEADSIIIIDARVSASITFSQEGGGEIFSTLFATVGVFSLPTDAIWGTVLSGGLSPEPLFSTYDQSVTPVRYERLDDVALAYSGAQLITVTRESGDAKTLTYDVDGNLVLVQSDYTGFRKVLNYTTGQLTQVITEKN